MMGKMPASGSSLPSSSAACGVDSFDAEVERMLRQMSSEEKVGLLSGRSMWKAGGVPRLGVPALAMSDGPHGMRGLGLSGEAGAVLAPCELALAATFDEGLIGEVGTLLGEDCARRGASVLLGPCLNMQRSPLFGRHFECFSEDPYLSGRAAVAYIRGVQQHVAACAKHFVCNDQEKNRHTLNSVIDEATLREVYLAPFEAAVIEGGVESIMCGYNRLNGMFCTENEWLLQKVLRDEWHFQGWLVSDWFGNQSTVPALKAGLNVEMPGIEPRHYGGYLLEAVRQGSVSENLLDERCRPVLKTSLCRRATSTPGPALQASDSQAFMNRRRLLLRAASSSIVLLRNEAGALPLEGGDSIRRLAVVGPSAVATTVQGGGSARVRPRPCSSILDAFRAANPRLVVLHEPGCHRGEHQWHHPEFKVLRPMAGCTASGQASAALHEVIPTRVFDISLILGAKISNNECFRRFVMPVARCLGWRQNDPAEIAQKLAKSKQPAHGHAEVDAKRTTRLACCASITAFAVFASLSVWASSSHWYRLGAISGVASVCTLVGQFWCCRRHAQLRRAEDRMLRAAETVASDSDACVVVLGTDGDFEGEGDDQPDMALPGRQNELVERVVASSRGPVIVVLNVGSPKELPWLNSVSAVVLAHFGGEEMAQAVVDTILGINCPAGRLPTTWPRRLEDAPVFATAHGWAPSARELELKESTTLLGAPTTRPRAVGHGHLPGECIYTEGLRVGYRSFSDGGALGSTAPLFPFGFGLSYTAFAYGTLNVKLEVPCASAGGPQASVSLIIQNTGRRSGSEVVQLYTDAVQGNGKDAASQAAQIRTGPRSLRGFSRTGDLAPGEEQAVTFTLGPRALGSSYCVEQGAWTRPQPGMRVCIEVGASSTDVRISSILNLS